MGVTQTEDAWYASSKDMGICGSQPRRLAVLDPVGNRGETHESILWYWNEILKATRSHWGVQGKEMTMSLLCFRTTAWVV